MKNSLECNGAEFALNRHMNKDLIPETSYSARAYMIHDKKKIPVYTAYIRDNVAKKYVKDTILVQEKNEDTRKELYHKGYNFVKTLELDGKKYLLGIIRTDNMDEALRNVYLVDTKPDDIPEDPFDEDVPQRYKLYKSYSAAAGTAIVDVCPQSEMVVNQGESVSVGKWTKKYFLGDGFRKIVKDYLQRSDTAFNKNSHSSLTCVGGEVTQYAGTVTMKAALGYQKAILEGVDVESNTQVSDSIAVVRRSGEAPTGDIVLKGVSGKGTNDPEKLEAYRKELEANNEAVTESEPPAQEESQGEAVSPAAASTTDASTTGSFVSSGTFLWILIPIAVIVLGAVVLVVVRRKK